MNPRSGCDALENERCVYCQFKHSNGRTGATSPVEKLRCIIVRIISPHKGIPFSTMSSFKIHTGERVMEKPIDREKEAFPTCLTCMVGS